MGKEKKKGRLPSRTQWDIWCEEGKEEELLEVIENCSLMGLSNANIAQILNISESTFRAWLKSYPNIKEACRKGHGFNLSNCAGVLLELMNSQSVDPSLRASIASKFLSYELERWKAINEESSSGAEGNGGDDGSVTLIFKRSK